MADRSPLTPEARAALVSRLEQFIAIPAGLSLATDPPKRYFTEAQVLVREARDLLAALHPPSEVIEQHDLPEAAAKVLRENLWNLYENRGVDGDTQGAASRGTANRPTLDGSIPSDSHSPVAALPVEGPAPQQITNCHCGRCHCGFSPEGSPVHALGCCQKDHRDAAIREWQRMASEQDDAVKSLVVENQALAASDIGSRGNGGSGPTPGQGDVAMRTPGADQAPQEPI